MKKLDPTELAALAQALPDWQYAPDRGGLLRRDFMFEDFV